MEETIIIGCFIGMISLFAYLQYKIIQLKKISTNLQRFSLIKDNKINLLFRAFSLIKNDLELTLEKNVVKKDKEDIIKDNILFISKLILEEMNNKED